jgi:hypothetical protein
MAAAAPAPDLEAFLLELGGALIVSAGPGACRAGGDPRQAARTGAVVQVCAYALLTVGPCLILQRLRSSALLGLLVGTVLRVSRGHSRWGRSSPSPAARSRITPSGRCGLMPRERSMAADHRRREQR